MANNTIKHGKEFRMNKRSKRRFWLTLMAAWAVGTLAVVGLTGCDNDGQRPQYARVCVDQTTHERVDGARCDSGTDGFLFWYLVYGRTLPSYGQPVVGGYQHVNSTVIVQQAEKSKPGKSYTSSSTRSYSTGAGKKLGTTSGGTGYKAPAPKAPAAPAVKAPIVRPAVPAVRPPAPAIRPAPVRIGK